MDKIRGDAHNRKLEISHIFSMLNESENPLDKYFLARSTVVFTYGTLEKFIKDISSLTLKIVLNNEYYNKNYVKELMQLLKYQNKYIDLFDLLMLHKGTYSKDFDQSKDKAYFLRSSHIDSTVIAHIINVFNLNRFEPMIRIPKLSIDSISTKRMQLAHGDYIRELQRFNASRRDLSLEEVNYYINQEFRLNDTTRSEILTFIDDFTDKIVLFIEDIKVMKGSDFKVGN